MNNWKSSHRLWTDASPAWRLSMAVFISAALHVLVAVFLYVGPKTYQRAANSPHVLLARMRSTNALPVLSPPPPQTSSPAPAQSSTRDIKSVPADSKQLERQAKFASSPDFEALEALPTVEPAQLKLRIYIAASSKLERIEILDSKHVPAEFLPVIFEQLEQREYLAAIANGQPEDGFFDILIFANPASDMHNARMPLNPRTAEESNRQVR